MPKVLKNSNVLLDEKILFAAANSIFLLYIGRIVYNDISYKSIMGETFSLLGGKIPSRMMKR
jgi:hypothetical protein